MMEESGSASISRRAGGATALAGIWGTGRGFLANRVPSHHFLQRFLLIAAFLSVDHHPDAVWIALLAVALNLIWASRFEGLVWEKGNAARWQGRAETGLPYPLERTREIIRHSDAAEAHLVGLGDKQVLWSADGRAFLMYARQGSRLIALFDPVGPDDCWTGLIEGFVALARRQRLKPVFYQVSARLLAMDRSHRLRRYKLGERADVRLDRFSLQGKEWASLRRALNRAERDGLTFHYCAAGDAVALMAELQAVSDAWLGMNKTGEKRFSLGAFDPAYVNDHPLAYIRFEGRIIAFVNILTAGNNAFVDLMRFVPGVHRGAMDLLVVKLIGLLKEEGYTRLNLGMAPLSGLGERGRAPAWERLGRLVYERGNRFYNFKGLRAFKEKFDPEWNDRYLVVTPDGNAALSAMAAAILIAGGVKRVFGR